MGKIKQKIIRVLINIFGALYIKIEQHLEYPHDDNILGIKIDKLLQNKNRKELCRYMDRSLPEKGFFELDSTTKIRLGCQLLKHYNSLKRGQSNEINNRTTPKSTDIKG